MPGRMVEKPTVFYISSTLEAVNPDKIPSDSNKPDSLMKTDNQRKPGNLTAWYSWP